MNRIGVYLFFHAFVFFDGDDFPDASLDFDDALQSSVVIAADEVTATISLEVDHRGTQTTELSAQLTRSNRRL